jgi:hypothetical protein
MMFKNKPARLAAFAFFIAGAAVFISCQDGTTAPTAGRELGTDQEEILGICGHTYDAESGAIEDALVVWHCETCDALIGEDVTNAFGWYEIYLTESEWLLHEGHDLKGTATHPAYQPAYAYIDDFSYQFTPYTRNFLLTSK